MNFGEKLKQIRSEKNWTQPQMAEAIGIEQSYLSKLENDKSVPSAEMFQTIVKALDLDVHDFLKDIDRKVLNGPLKQIPEVANYLTTAAVTKVHNAKQWLIGSAAACTVGAVLMLAAFEGIFFSNFEYRYHSDGVILANESDDIFDSFRKIQALKLEAKVLSPEQAALAVADFESNRVRHTEVKLDHDKGMSFYENVDNGRRRFYRADATPVRRVGNNMLQLLGALFLFGGIAGFFVEWRLRRLQTH